MFKLGSLALVALAAVSAVNAVAVYPRKTPPAGWIAEILESYDDYNTRYLAIGCQNKHNTQFFDDCCHPMKKGETLEKNRKPYCRPGVNPSTPAPSPVETPVKPSSPSPESTPVPDEGDDCEDDGDDTDDDEDEPEYSPAPNSTPTPNHTPTPEKPTPSPVKPSPTPVKPSPTPVKPSPTPVDTPSTETHNGGHVTWYTQNGNYGACGVKHSDNDFIAALDYRVYGNLSAKSKYCGQKIRVSWQGKSVDVVVADACPTCDNSGSVDLSLAAFKALAPLDVGLLTDVTWKLL